MSSKNQHNTKQPKVVEVKLLVPYAIVAVMVVAGLAFIGGWFTHVDHQHQVRSEAAELVADLKSRQ